MEHSYVDFNNDCFDVKDIIIDMSKQRHGETLFREEIIRQLMAILISEGKSNALLIGPAGSGKTKIVEELSYRIAKKQIDVPQMLYSSKIYALRLSDIVSGCCLVGDLEKKLKTLIDYFEDENNKAIMFLDEVHMLFSGETYKKVAQILKPALSRSRIKVIAATTTQEVRKLETDPAFNRRFTRVLVDELSKEQTGHILVNYSNRLCKHYGLKISTNSALINAVIATADEFCSVGSHRPDNALTLLDRSVASTVMKLQQSGTYKNSMKINLSEDIIEETAVKMISGNSELRVFDEIVLRKNLESIRGQEHIVEDILKVLKLHNMHIRPTKKPLTFLFAGASGVGKTELTKILAKICTNDKPITLNMTEYQFPSSIYRIIGDPIQMNGDSNELPFDILDTNPYKFILLDEFEKCDKSVQRLFMSVFDEGFLCTSTGRMIDFSKAIIIATTNAGYTDKKSSIGFTGDDLNCNRSVAELSDYFDVELLNRFSHRYFFKKISKEVYEEILADMYEKEVNKIMADARNIRLPKFTKKLAKSQLDMLVAKSYCAQFGARPAYTIISEYIDSLILTALDREW